MSGKIPNRIEYIQESSALSLSGGIWRENMHYMWVNNIYKYIRSVYFHTSLAIITVPYWISVEIIFCCIIIHCLS